MGVNDVGVSLIYLGFKTIAQRSDVPVGIYNTVFAGAAAGASQTQVVLRAAMHMVKGPGIVRSHFIKLGNGQIFLEMPATGKVPCFVDAAIAANQQVVIVFGVYPNAVVVNMLVYFTEILDGFTTIVAHFVVGIGNKNTVCIHGVTGKLLVIITAGKRWIALFPTGATIGTAVYAAAFVGLHYTVQQTLVYGTGINTNPALVATG